MIGSCVYSIRKTEHETITVILEKEQQGGNRHVGQSQWVLLPITSMSAPAAYPSSITVKRSVSGLPGVPLALRWLNGVTIIT